jgi:hypothetical protein
VIEASAGRFGSHGLCWFFHADQYTDLRAFTLDDMTEVADHGYVKVLASLYGQNDLFRRARWALVMKVQATINALVGALFAFQGSCIDEAERPPLELIGVVSS